MQPYQQRVIEEHAQLIEKLNKLGEFISVKSEVYRELPLMEKERLHLQAYLMNKYLTVLNDRIAYFNEI